METGFEEPIERVDYDFGLNRRSFVQFLGAGLLIAVGATPALAQRREGRGGGGAKTVSARIHIGADGKITVLTGKVEAGQGARAELAQAAAEELHVPLHQVQLIMADTAQVPDDGITAGSRSTPSTVPAVRQGAAAARELLVELAAKQWNVDASQIQVQDGKATHGSSQDVITYADLGSSKDATERLARPIAPEIALTTVSKWKVLGTAQSRSNGRDIVTGLHRYPSDISRPDLLYAKVLRPPSYGAKLVSVDVAPAKALKDVIVVQDDQFVGVAAPSTIAAEKALEAVASTAKWETSPHPSSKELFGYLRDEAQGGIPANPFADQVSQAKQLLRQTYHVAYVQHAPLEPRAAVAEWTEGKLTVWTGTQNPFGCRSELVRAFHLAEERVRVIVPDFGSGYGGKHSGEVGVEAARIAQVANRPVSLRWTREEEFTWAYFRPAAVIQIEASVDAENVLTSWHHINVNSGGSAIDTPYQTGKRQSHFVNSKPPLRQGSYRALAATANTFARESAMDELAAMAKADPLDFRLAHLQNEDQQQRRLRAVLEKATTEFGWREALKKKDPARGVGLACGTEKGSYVAACAEIEIDRAQRLIRVSRVCEAFECGAILNPDNLQNQVQGAIIMGLGPALREEMRFENGQMLNASFRGCQVPRFADVPEIAIHLVNRTDLESIGAGETPIIAIAPAIANALFQATGIRVREMPIRIPASV